MDIFYLFDVIKDRNDRSLVDKKSDIAVKHMPDQKLRVTITTTYIFDESSQQELPFEIGAVGVTASSAVNSKIADEIIARAVVEAKDVIKKKDYISKGKK